MNYGIFMCNIGLGNMGKKEREKEKISKRILGDTGFPHVSGTTNGERKQKEEISIVTATKIANRHLGVQRTAATKISISQEVGSAKERGGWRWK